MDFSNIMSDPELAGGFGAILGFAIGIIIFIGVVFLITTILKIIGQWQINKKAGEPGWAAIVPFYNTFVLMKIAKLDWWHFLIFTGCTFMIYIPNETISGLFSIAFLVYYFIINIRLAKAFGKTTGFGVFSAFFPYIAYLILGYGKATYEK